jgi:hypothetical protein
VALLREREQKLQLVDHSASLRATRQTCTLALAKYGALSNEEGIAGLTWSPSNDSATVRVVWKERGDPRVRKSTRKGFGRPLIERAIPGAKVNHVIAAEGVTCSIDLPLVSGIEHAGIGK